MTVRWGLIALCALMLVGSPGSAAVLAPLLLLAVVLGSRHTRPYAVASQPPTLAARRRRRPVTLH